MANGIRSSSVYSSPAHDSPASAQRRPSKKSSFLSLKRDKKSTETLSPASPAESSNYSRSAVTSPSSFHAFGLDSPDSPTISYPYSLKSQRSRSGSKGANSAKEVRSPGRAKEKHRETRSPPPTDEWALDYSGESQEYVPWPAAEDEETNEVRSRANSGPSRRHPWDHHMPVARSINYPYRDSGSSTLSQFEPPPQTPIDDYSFREHVFSIPVVVAAPVPGVATMDALVDGMNGSSEEEQYAGLSNLASNRSHFKKTGHHPLYHPPLPTPPPGVKLGGGRPRESRRHGGSDSDELDSPLPSPALSRRSHHSSEKKSRPRSSRASSNTTVTTRYPTFTMPTIELSSSKGSVSSKDDYSFSNDSSFRNSVASDAFILPTKSMAPSISDIIRAHAPAEQQARSMIMKKASAEQNRLRQQTSLDNARSLPTIEDPDLLSRSSVDTLAEEIRHTLRTQAASPVMTQPPLRTPSRPPKSRPQSSGTDYTRSPISEGRRNSSLFSYSTVSDVTPTAQLDLSGLTMAPTNSPSQTIAQYLHSSRLTTILKLTRAPHASHENPLSISLSDLGCPTGTPLVVFLGLGCVRHIMGLYDEMAECLGLRLITIDRYVSGSAVAVFRSDVFCRWGLGKSDSPRSKLVKGIPEWASVVEEVLDQLGVGQCSIMAHSAGAPYALAFANRFPERIRGDVCLLAPWVGGGEGCECN